MREDNARSILAAMKPMRFLKAVALGLTIVTLSGCFSMIHRSIDRDDLPGVREELDQGEDIERRNIRDHTPLLWAAKADRDGIVRYLVEQGADINATTPVKTGEVTALRYAIDNGNYELASFLIDHGADVNQKNEKGWTPLMTAARTGRIDIIDMLLEAGADLTARTDGGTDAIRAASDAGYTDVVVKLTLLKNDTAQ